MSIQIENYTVVRPLVSTFTLTPIHVAYANTLRRLIMTGVESAAFRADMKDGTTTDVTVEQNDTPMTNEMLAHRIGLLPIHVPMDTDLKTLTFSIDVKADKDTYKDVTCDDFVIMREREGGKEPVQMDTDDFFPKHPLTRRTCLIATLAPGSGRVKFTAKASMGTGRENARFQPTSQCSYVYTRDEDEATVDAHFTEWLEKAKKQSVGDLEEGDEKAKAKLAAFRREYETMEIAKVYLKDAKGEPYSYDFTIETVGPLKISYIVRRACDVGAAMMSKYTSIANGVLPDDNKLRVIPSRSRVLGFDFIMKEQDHTFGNMIQTYLEQNHIYEGDQKAGGPVKITYAGYEVPHPLRDELVVRIGSSSKEEALQAFAQACEGCVQIFNDMRTAWMRTVPEAGVNVAKEALTAAVKPDAGVTKARATAAAIVAAAKTATATATAAPAKSTKATATTATEPKSATARVPKK
jgi:DNA-directed RNA polymerase subunit D